MQEPFGHARQVIEVYDGKDVWSQLRPALRKRGQRRAAVAYIGSGAKKYLGLKDGDVLVFDGDVTSVEQGHVNLDEVRAMINAGVKLYSRPGLHSKIMVLEAATPVALVGSANASVTAATIKSETVVVFDDPEAVQAVRDAVASLKEGLKALNGAWVGRMIPHLPKHQRCDSRFERVVGQQEPLAKRGRSMWAWTYHWSDGTDPVAITAAVARAEAARGLKVTAFQLIGKDSAVFDSVAVGHSALYLPLAGSTSSPRRNALVFEPEKVIDKVPSARGEGGYVLTAARLKPAQLHWSEVDATLRRFDVTIDSDINRVAPSARLALFERFAIS